MKHQKQRAKGFTLLELLMVVIIIGILASVALPQYFRVTERTRVAQMLPVLSAIRGSEVRFRAQDASQSYTTVLASLDIDFPVAWPVGWAAPVVTGVAGGSNATTARVGGTHAGATLEIDLDTGAICASTAAAAADWGVSAAAC